MRHTVSNMRKLNERQQGFITMIIMLLAILIAAIGLVYLRVARAQR